MNYNKVILAGNLTREPELKTISSGTTVCQFGIAVNRKWKDAQWQPKEEVYFGDCQAWGKLGENIAKYFSKGRPIFIEGELRLEQWEKDGVKQSKTRINVLSFQFCGGDKPERDAAPLATAKSGTPAMKVQADDDSLPF